MLLLWKVEPKIESLRLECKNPKCMKKYSRDPGSCKLNMDEGTQVQVERKKAQEQAEQAEQEHAQQAQQEEQEQAETEGRRRSQRLRVQRNQSDQYSV